MRMFISSVLLLATAVLGASAVCVTISPEQVALIQQSWDIAKRNGDLAPDTFISFFRRNPTYQKVFARFADVPLDQLKTNGDFLAQAYTVAAGLNHLVEALGSQALVEQQVAHLGIAHKSRGAQAWHFDELATALVGTLRQTLGKALSPQAEDAWIDALNSINKAIVANLKDRYDVANTETNLTPNQVKTVKANWASVRDDRQKLGEEVLAQLLADNPSYIALFPKFASVAPADLAGNAEFRKQAGAVVDRLDVVIENLDNDLVLVGQLIYLGHTHFPRRVTREHFTKFGVDLVQNLAKRGVSQSDLGAWRQVLPTLLEQVIDNLN